MDTSALKGLKVLDLTRVLSGPFATMLLADFGAEVIKVEQPQKGDDSRHFSPLIKDESAYFMSINRNKKSVTLNLKSEEGKEIFKKLIQGTDIIIENFRPGTMEKLGLDYPVLQTLKPDLIYAAISGYGATGPYSRRAAYDGIIQAMGGMMSITGEKGGKPLKVGASIIDIMAGVFCAVGILMAVIHKKNTGKGQFIDVAMLDSQIAILENAVVRYLVTGEIPVPMGNTHMSIFPFETFCTKDADIMISAGNNVLWEKLCTAIGRPGMVCDERFADNPSRGNNRDAMYDEINAALRGKSADEWCKILDDAGVPCSPINYMDKVLKNPQVLARDMLVNIEHPIAGNTTIPGIPIKMSETPGSIRKAAPILSDSTEEIFKERLNIEETEFQRLLSAGVV